MVQVLRSSAEGGSAAPPAPDALVTRARLLVAVTGVPGTGKSAVADAAGQLLGAAVFAHDWAMSGLRPYPELHLGSRGPSASRLGGPMAADLVLDAARPWDENAAQLRQILDTMVQRDGRMEMP